MGQWASTPVQRCEWDLKLAKEQGNKQQEKQAYLRLVDAHLSINQLKQAFEYIEKILQFQEDQEHRIEKLLTRDSTKILSTILDAHDDSKKNLHISNTSDGIQLQDAQHKTADNAEQIDIDKKAIKIEDDSRDTEDDNKVSYNQNLGAVFILSDSNNKKAIKYYKKAREISPGLEANELEVEAYERLGYNHLLVGQYKESLECYEEVVKLASQLGNKKRKLDAYLVLGSVFSNTGDFESSENYFLKALAMTEQLNDKILQLEALMKLGHVYYVNGKFDAALRSYLKAQEIFLNLRWRLPQKTISHDLERAHYWLHFVIFRNFDSRKYETNIWFMLGNTFEQLRQEEKAIESYQKAINISKELKDKEMQMIAKQRLGISCLTLASVCSKDRDYDTAVRWYEKALDVFGTKRNNCLLREKALTGLGVAWFSLGCTEKAIESIQKAQKFSKTETDTDKNSTEKKPSSSQIPELLKSVEETCNSTSTEMLQNEDLVSLAKHIKEFPSSNVYTLPSSSKEPLTDNDRKTMTANVKSSAYKTLLSPNKSKIHANNEKFVNEDQQIINFANDDLYKNPTTKIPARLLKSLDKNMKSIGQISCGNVRGTCWLVIDMLVMTNLHVYRQFNKEREDRQNPNLPITVSFDYLHPGQREHVVTVEVDEVRDPRLENPHLDYKFLRLKENEGLRGRDPLGPLVRSRPLQDGLVIILGHPAGSEMHEETCVVVSSHSWREKLQKRHQAVSLHMTNDDLLRARARMHESCEKYQNQGCLPYDTSLFSGASGSPVFDVNGNIIAMHTQGYTLEAQEGNVSLMEFGVQFNAICEDMRGRNLVDQYFPNYNLGTGEEQMDED